MKKLPRVITVYGRHIPIKALPGSTILEMYPEFSHAPQGLWDAGRKFIVINSDFELQDQRYTLLHELGHTVMTFNGIDLVVPPELMEIIVQSFATLTEDILDQSAKLK